VRTRWLITVAVAAALVAVPLVDRLRPVSTSPMSPVALAADVRAAAALSWSGLVRSSGGARLPAGDTLAGVGDVLGGDNDLRVWWAGPQRWRIDRLRSTGEVDLFRADGYTIRWEFETRSAVSAPVSEVRLPDVSDVVPVSLAQFVLSGVADSALSAIPARRVAGIDAAGLRVRVEGNAASVQHVDLWADPATGLPLRVEVVVPGERRPALTTEVTELRVGPVPESVTVFTPPMDSSFRFDQSVDVAAEANAFAPYDLPPALAGLGSRTGRDPGAAGAYGTGPTVLVALPLRGSVAGPLRAQLREAGARRSGFGLYAPTGPIGLLLTSGRYDLDGQGGGFLLAGTVTADTLQRAAGELVGRR
jgi:hypothetical protein